MIGRLSALEIGDDGALIATRVTYGGRVALRLRITSDLVVAIVQAPWPDVETIPLGQAPAIPIMKSPLASKNVALERADIIVSGGRGVDAAGFALLAQISALIGGAVGASLPAVDLGLASVAQQIGQSGKFVSPAIYLAVGLSGTPQHLAGIGAATRIIAINNDREAEIFRFAEIGVVTDARTLLPALVAALETCTRDREKTA